VLGQAWFDQLPEKLDSYSFHMLASGGVFSSLMLLSNTDLSKDETKEIWEFQSHSSVTMVSFRTYASCSAL